MRPDAVRAGDEVTERLLRRAFIAGFYEASDAEDLMPTDEQFGELFSEWRSSVLTIHAPSLSLSQIDYVLDALGSPAGPVPESILHRVKLLNQATATLWAMRAELTREDGGDGS